jgi:Ca2+-binding EF-hand superfamily protein
LTKEKAIELKKIFDRMDRDCDGRIDAADFAKGQSPIEMKESMFSYFNTNSRFISFEEFLFRLFPNLSQDHLTTMLKWVKQRDHEMRMVVNTRRIKSIARPKRKLTGGLEEDRVLTEQHDTH